MQIYHIAGGRGTIIGSHDLFPSQLAKGWPHDIPTCRDQYGNSGEVIDGRRAAAVSWLYADCNAMCKVRAEYDNL
jgi:hypothetical protein